MSDHFEDRAGLIASLPDEDPERVAALRHAEQCSPCRRALLEGERLMRVIDDAREPAELPAGSIDRVTRTIEAEIRLEPIRQAAWPAALAALAFVLELAMARHPDRDPGAVGRAIIVAAIAMGLAAWNRGKLTAVVAAVATSAAFALASASTSLLAPLTGVHCMLLELLAAALPWIAFRRVAGPWRGTWASAAVAAAGALAGHAALHLTCPTAHADAHLFVFHVGGVVLAALLAVLATPRLGTGSAFAEG